MKNYKTLELKKNEALMITTPSKVEFPNPKPVKKSVISQFRSYLPLGP